MSDQVRFLVDQVEEPVQRGMLPGAGKRAMDIVVGVTAQALKERMAELIRPVSEAVSAVSTDDLAFEAAEVRFTMHFGADGEVSIMSVAKGAVSAGTGIEVTLRKRPSSPAPK